jgi:hypothetical protein
MAVKSATEIKEDVRKRTRGSSYNRDFYKTLNDLADSGERIGLTVTAGEEVGDVITIALQVVASDGTTPVAGVKTFAVYALTDDAATPAAVTVEAGTAGTSVSATGNPQAILSTNAAGALDIVVSEDMAGDETEALIKIVPVNFVGAGALLAIQFDDEAGGGGGG